SLPRLHRSTSLRSVLRGARDTPPAYGAVRFAYCALRDGRGMSLCGGGSRQHEILEAFAQHRLLNLAGRGVRDLVDENDLVGHPPLGDLAAHEFEDLVLGRR